MTGMSGAFLWGSLAVLALLLGLVVYAFWPRDRP